MVAIKTLLDILTTLAAILCLAPVMPFLSPPGQLLAALAVLGGIWCDQRGRYPLPSLPATLLALLGVLYYAAGISRNNVALPVIHALVVLMCVRLLTVKQARDYLQVFVLALFILAGSSLLSLEISFIIYLVLLVFAVTVSLVLLTVFVTDPRLALPRRDFWRLLRVALIMPVASLVLMLGFFVILPRTGQPLWNFLTPAHKTVSSLTESLDPGAFARLGTAKTLAFRVEGPELPPEDRYWRALVMNQPQGTRWVRAEPPAGEAARPAGGRPVTLTVYPEPRADRYLITLDRPQQVSDIRSQVSPDQVFRTLTPHNQRFRYTVQAVRGADLRMTGRIDPAFYLTVPERISPRLRQAAAQIAASGTDTATRVAALAAFFRDRGLVYARDDLPGGPDPVDAFLFEKRRGYCEFFAAAYVTLARLAGVPARLVGGYFGGDYNALGGYYLVTDDTAHVWVEVLGDEGLWQRVDPSQWASNAGTALNAARGDGLNPWQRLADTLNYHWIQLVVVFDLSRQTTLWRDARHMLHGWRLPTLEPRVILQIVGLLGLGGVGLWVVRQRRLSREARLLAALRLRARRRLGEDVALENLGLSELAERLDSEPCREFARIYQGAVFRDRPLTAAEILRLQELLKTI